MNRELLKEKLYLEKEIKDLTNRLRKEKKLEIEILVEMLQNIKTFIEQEIQIKFQK